MRYSFIKFGSLAGTIILSAAGYSAGQAGQSNAKYCFANFGQKEYAILVKDLSSDQTKKLKDDAGLRKKQTEGLRRLLAFECEAEKRGFARDETNAAELRNIRSETIASVYDKAVSKKPTQPPFSRITDLQVTEFYKSSTNAADFERFLKAKIDLLRRGNPKMADYRPTDAEREQAKSYFAKIKISESESARNASLLGAAFEASTDLKVRLQQAQFLARVLSDEMVAKQTAVTDDEVLRYINGHPEFDTAEKKAVALEVLEKAKAGDDFAALANQFSEDPGNAGSTGQKNGGLYRDVPKGTMVAPFENAALSLQPGEIYPELVESDFGFHIIKLESKTGTGTDLKYDVRHVLISTAYKDPRNPNTGGMPVKAYIRSKLESEKESAIVAKVIADNPIVMEDFQMPSPDAAKPAAKKPIAGKAGVRRKRH